MKTNSIKSVAVLFAIVFLSMANFNNHLMAQSYPIDDIVFDVPNLEALKDALGDNAYLLDEMQNGWLSSIQLVAPDTMQPSEGRWNSQEPLESEFKIDDCEFKFIAEWRCRVGHDGKPEIQILRLDVYAKTKSCKDLIMSFYSRILDHVVYKMFTNDQNRDEKDDKFKKCFSGLMQDLLIIKPCKEGFTSVFRVYVNTCGKNVTYRTAFSETTSFIPCGVTTFCRLKYKYCYYIEDGVQKIQAFVDPERYDDYGCPPFKVINIEGKNIEVDCRDYGCSGRTPGYYEVKTEPIFSIKDIEKFDGSSPIKVY